MDEDRKQPFKVPEKDNFAKLLGEFGIYCARSEPSSSNDGATAFHNMPICAKNASRPARRIIELIASCI
jgi:hypothetical protein